jgi:2'-5' RNA ligase
MLAVTSLLDIKHSELVNTIISDFEREFGVKQVQATPFPHITYLVTEALNLELLKDYLEKAGTAGKSFHIYTTGIGIFPGEHPVIYIPVLRTPALNRFHSKLYRDISKLSITTSPFSKPKKWLPHISLALGDTTLDMMTPMMKYLAHYKFDWEIKIDNLNIFRESHTSNAFVQEAVYSLAGSILT